MSHEAAACRATITPQEREAIAAWLAVNQPTICPPMTFSIDATQTVGSWREQQSEFYRAAKAKREAEEVKKQEAKPVGRAKYTDEQLAALLPQHTLTEAALILGVDPSSVVRRAKKLGLQAKPRHDPLIVGDHGWPTHGAAAAALGVPRQTITRLASPAASDFEKARLIELVEAYAEREGLKA
jgi:hypothetical protein